MSVRTFHNFIGGEWGEATGGETFEQRNPARLSEVTGEFQRSGAEDADRAVAAAAAAFPGWRALPPLRRAEYLKPIIREVVNRSDEIARVLTTENGKTLAESKAEITYALADMEFQLGEGIRLYGETVPVSMPGVQAYSIREPVGVAALISPWNFPFNVPCGKCISSLMAGCTVVFKPASKTPQVGLMLAEVFASADLPAGVLNCVTGGGQEIGSRLVSHPDVRAVSFTGSTAVGRAIHREAANTLTRTQLEMGGKNPIIVCADAEIDRTLNETIPAAYGCAGQKCTSTSRVIVVREIAEELTAQILERVSRLRVGDGFDEQADMGPVCGADQLESILAYIQQGRDEGATLLAGGEQLTGQPYDDGCFIAPTVFGDVRPEMSIAQEEIFGPVLCILVADDFDHAVDIANGVRYGLSASVYTRDLERALTFVERSEAGVTHVNLMTAINEPQLSFGGIKESGFGIPEAGRTGIDFFTEQKVAYVRYR